MTVCTSPSESQVYDDKLTISLPTGLTGVVHKAEVSDFLFMKEKAQAESTVRQGPPGKRRVQGGRYFDKGPVEDEPLQDMFHVGQVRMRERLGGEIPPTPPILLTRLPLGLVRATHGVHSKTSEFRILVRSNFSMEPHGRRSEIGSVVNRDERL